MTKTQNPKPVLVIETGDPPAGWGVRRTISNKEFRTAEVIERKKKMSLTSIFCGSLFCGSAVHILEGPDSLLALPMYENGHPGEAPGWGYSEKDQILTQPTVGTEPLTAQLFFQHIPVQILKA